jgi:hypothetical protein
VLGALSNIKQRRNEDMHAYAARFEGLVQTIPAGHDRPNDTILIAQFTNGLCSLDLKQELFRMTLYPSELYKSLNAIIALAIRFEAEAQNLRTTHAQANNRPGGRDSYYQHRPTFTKSAAPTTSAASSSVPMELGAMRNEEEDEDLEERKEERTEVNAIQTNRQRMDDKERAEYMSKGLSFKCKGRGHRARECPVKPKN